MLSVLMITYNQEKFIAQALDSVLMQEVDFAYEIVIGDDCSSDSTRSILLDYQQKFPDRIRLLLPEKNQGAMRNFVSVLKACQGEYVATLEGDDFWTCPYKMQNQVDFLASQPDFVMCFTNSLIVDEDGTTIKEDRLDKDRRKHLSQVEILSGLVPPTNTVVFRNKVIKVVPDVYLSCINGDILFFSSLTGYGDAGYIDRHTASYRVHEGGIWSKKSEEYMKKNTLKTRLALLHTFASDYRSILLPQVQWSYLDLMRYYIEKREIREYIKAVTGYFLSNARYGMLPVRKVSVASERDRL